MKVLLDTPLLSELIRAHPEDWVARWIDAFDEDELFLSTLTIGEMVKTIESESNEDHKANFYLWLNEELLIRFHGKIIPLDTDIMIEWGKIKAESETRGKPLSTADALIAATARAKGLVLVTYNRELFSEAGIEVSDPWQG